MLKSLFFILLTFLCFASPSVAAEGPSLTIYQNGTALVREVRNLELPAGTSELTLLDLPKSMRFGTLLVESVTAPGMLRVLSSEFQPGGISSGRVLERHIGKTLEFVLPDTRNVDSRRVVKARLLGIESGSALLELDDGKMWIGPYEAVLLDSAPADAVLTPLMTCRFNNSGPLKQNIALSYLAGGLDWNAELVLRKGKNGRYALAAWGTLMNRSGKRYEDARVMLVAGDVRRSSYGGARNGMVKAAVMMEADMAQPPMPKRSEFGQWHLYDAGKGYTLPAGAQTRISLFEVPDIPVQRRLHAYGNVGLSPRRSVEQRALDVQLVLENKGSGQPIPSGIVRVYEPGPGGAPLFAGETGIGNVPEGGKATLVLGKAFDVTMDRKQTEFRKTGKRHYVVGYEMTVRNARSDEAEVVLEEAVSGMWKLVKSNVPMKRKDAGTMLFELKVPGNKSVSVTYTIETELQ